MQDDLTPPTPDDVIPLTRENIRSGRIREWVAKNDVSFQPLSDDASRRTRAAMFPPTGRPAGPAWLFGHGSPLWHQAYDYAVKRPATWPVQTGRAHVLNTVK